MVSKLDLNSPLLLHQLIFFLFFTMPITPIQPTKFLILLIPPNPSHILTLTILCNLPLTTTSHGKSYFKPSSQDTTSFVLLMALIQHLLSLSNLTELKSPTPTMSHGLGKINSSLEHSLEPYPLPFILLCPKPLPLMPYGRNLPKHMLHPQEVILNN